MKQIRKIISILFIGIFLTSCATSAKYTEVVKSWEGHDINNLITSWGPPSDLYTMPNGNKMYTWLYVSSSLVTTRYNYWLDRLETRQVQYWCKTTFTANKSDRIIYWRWNGNACRSD